MPYTLVFTEQYSRKATRFINKHPELRQQYLNTLQLLEADPFHPSLCLHPLHGKHKDLHWISINLSYHITLELLIQNERIMLVNVGDHDAVYLSQTVASIQTTFNPKAFTLNLFNP